MTLRRESHPAESFTVDSTFLVDLLCERIVVYLARQDIFAILRERGILSD